MRVTLVTARYADAAEGGGAVSAALLVACLRSRGHDVTVLAGKTSSLDTNVFEVPLTVASLRRQLRALAPDVAHAYNLDVAPTTVIAGRLAHVPVAATVNGHTAVCLFGDQLHPERGPCGPCSVSKIKRCFAVRPDWQVGRRVPAVIGVAEVKRRTALLSRADALFALSNSTRDVLTRCGVPAARITVVPNLVDAAFTGSSTHEPRFLFVGKLDVQKAPDLLIEAAAVALPELPDWHLDIVGDGPLRPRLDAMVKAAELEDRVTFHGFVAPRDLVKHYGRASAVVTPGRWEEPFARVVLEAAAFGVPLVTSSRGGNAEAVTSGTNGLVVPPDDVRALARALVDVAGDRARTRAWGDAFRATLARHAADAVLPTYERTYERIARTPSL